jgi:hypothetical protein
MAFLITSNSGVIKHRSTTDTNAHREVHANSARLVAGKSRAKLVLNADWPLGLAPSSLPKSSSKVLPANHQNLQTHRNTAKMALPGAHVLAERKARTRSRPYTLYRANMRIEAHRRRRDHWQPSIDRLSRTLAWREPRLGPRLLCRGARPGLSLLPCIIILTPPELWRPVPLPPAPRDVLLPHWPRHLSRQRLPPHPACRDPHPRHRKCLHQPEHVHYPGRSARPPPGPDTLVRFT